MLYSKIKKITTTARMNAKLRFMMKQVYICNYTTKKDTKTRNNYYKKGYKYII